MNGVVCGESSVDRKGADIRGDTTSIKVIKKGNGYCASAEDDDKP
ncbi:hypothetical protein THOM_0174 [Trachipleistophora hominis]|uniref:Uncharacterized protein n=1 Tax=Trachipleistophora hominis TaxID=72359 RepID=L7JZT5_TRAHO|nr:hypothetical protein THOM_0174 [Trachipleistophora hominis]